MRRPLVSPHLPLLCVYFIQCIFSILVPVPFSHLSYTDSIVLDMNILNGLTIASINCNSLNMSSSSKILQHTKLYGVAKIKTDIIFLSDIRLSNKNLVSNFNNIANIFRTNPYASYQFFHNSSKNKRGTGILIKNDVDFSELARRTDPEENYLLLMAELKGNRVIIGSIYGPNDHDNNFFTSLERDIVSLGNYPVILGGIGIVLCQKHLLLII